MKNYITHHQEHELRQEHQLAFHLDQLIAHGLGVFNQHEDQKPETREHDSALLVLKEA